jgi:hypothetical protein
MIDYPKIKINLIYEGSLIDEIEGDFDSNKDGCFGSACARILLTHSPHQACRQPALENG